MAQWLDAQVTKKTNWNDHLFSLSFNCEDFASYKAGQFAKIGIEDAEGKVLSRPYSLVSSPGSNELEIIAVPVEDGSLSPQLHALKAGDNLKVMAPATGFLVLDEVPQSSTLWMLATGTGVGPFLSILHTEQAWKSYEKIVLVYAARYVNDLAYLSMIESWQKIHSEQFRFVPIVSREFRPGGLQGRIPALLESGDIQALSGCQLDAQSSQIMLCGNPDMIVETNVVLENMGLKKHLRRSPGQISMERYW